MPLEELRCKSCGAPLKAENIVERLSMARCGYCNAVFALDVGGDEQPGDDTDRGKGQLRPRVSLPKGVEMQDFGVALEIRRRWFGPMFLFLAFFCVVWNGFVLFWHGIAFSQGIWFMSFFGLLHTAVGIGLLYYTVAGFVNTTTIRVGQGLLEITHAPLPWPGNKRISTDNLEQLYCQEKVHHGKNGSTITYCVQAVRSGTNTRQTLLKGLSDPDQALYIEQELERFLKLEDRAVQGELAR